MSRRKQRFKEAIRAALSRPLRNVPARPKVHRLSGKTEEELLAQLAAEAKANTSPGRAGRPVSTPPKSPVGRAEWWSQRAERSESEYREVIRPAVERYRRLVKLPAQAEAASQTATNKRRQSAAHVAREIIRLDRNGLRSDQIARRVGRSASRVRRIRAASRK